MQRSIRRLTFAAAAAVLVAAASTALAQRGGSLTPEQAARRWEIEKALQSVAIVERKVMMPMRDGVRLATDIYRPKDVSKKVPAIWVRTPYNFNFWDVRNGVPRDMTAALTAVKRGYAYVVQNERGHFFSEGNYDILGPPLTDGYDALAWLSSQPWSNGKVGTTGCSSTAEYQMGVAAMGHPAYAAMNVQGFGAGVGRVGPYYEQGNWYRGGAVQMLFITWLYGEQNQVRPMFPPNTSQEDLIRASKSIDLAQQLPPVDWSKALWHLPVQDILKAVDGPRGIFADAMPVETGGRMIQRTPNDPTWYKGGLYHDNMPLEVPGLWFMSWYDVSVGPNLALYNHVRKTARPEIANQQWAIIAPVTHCAYARATERTIVGERDMGDARLNYAELTYGFFDRVLKGETSDALDKLSKVTYYTMGMNKWQSSDTWPPRGAQPMTLFLSSGGKANSLEGDGTLTLAPPAADAPDSFTYDPISRHLVRWERLLHRQCHHRRLVRSTPDGSAARHPGLHFRAVQGRDGSQRADRTDSLRLVRREGHRFHRQGHRRLSRRARLQPGRVDPAHALPRRIRQAARVDGAGEGVQGHAPAADDEQLLRGRPPVAHRGVEQQLPAIRPEPQHQRQQLRRGQGRGGPQRRPPLEAVPVEDYDHRGQAIGSAPPDP